MENGTGIYVIMCKVCKYVNKNGEKQFCLIVVLLQKTTFIKMEGNL